jgi:hypothetical protein
MTTHHDVMRVNFREDIIMTSTHDLDALIAERPDIFGLIEYEVDNEETIHILYTYIHRLIAAAEIMRDGLMEGIQLMEGSKSRGTLRFKWALKIVLSRANNAAKGE